MRNFAGCAALLPMLLPCPGYAETDLESLLKRCEEKTIVMGRDEDGQIVRVGERIDGYCRGFLEGVFSVLLQNGDVCVKSHELTPEFLLSTVQTYRSQTELYGENAVSAVEAAFRRAFSCSE